MATVRVLDTRQGRPTSAFARFKAFVEGIRPGVRVDPLPGAGPGSHQVYCMRAIAGVGTVLGASAVEDPSVLRSPGNGAAGPHLCFALSGEGVHHVLPSGPALSPAAGQLVVVGTEHVAEVRRRTWRAGLLVPVSALRVTRGELEQVLAQEVTWHEWQSSFLAGFCRSVLAVGSGPHAVPGHHLDQLAAGAAEFIVRSAVDGDRELSASALRRARARGHIALHASEPDLSPAAVAAEQGITLRQLARCFAEEGTTVSAEIKRIRLERARTFLLAHAGQGRISLAEVARRNGFSSLSHFSRSFAEAYGVPPSQLLRP